MFYAKFFVVVNGQGLFFISLGIGVFEPFRYDKFKSQMHML